MTVELVHPDGVFKVEVHHQVSVAQGTKVVSLAGQVGWDETGTLIGAGDLAAQTEQCYVNIAAALASVGGSMADLTRLTHYVVELDADKTELVGAGRNRAAERLGVALQQPGTYIGVTSLFAPDFLIEVEATAVLA